MGSLFYCDNTLKLAENQPCRKSGKPFYCDNKLKRAEIQPDKKKCRKKECGNEKPLTEEPNVQVLCQGFFNIKGEYENLLENGRRKGEVFVCLPFTIYMIHNDSKIVIGKS